MYGLSCFYEECSATGWYNYNIVIAKKNGAVIPLVDSPFIRTLYYMFTTSLLMSIEKTYMYNITDMLAHFCIVTCSYFIFSFSFAEICATFILRQQEKTKYLEFIAAMNFYMHRNKLSGALRQRVGKIMQFKWVYNKSIVVAGKSSRL